MPQLKATFFELNGVIVQDAAIQFELVNDLLLAENLRPIDLMFQESILGKSDRLYLKENLAARGRFVTDEYLSQLIQQKFEAYCKKMLQLDPFPLYEDVLPCLDEMRQKQIALGIVTGSSRQETLFVLEQAQLLDYFDLIITADEVSLSKPAPDSYLVAIAKLHEKYPERDIQPQNCLAVEDGFTGIQAAKAAGIPVVGVAHSYPFHMLQRCSNWCVDYLTELELDRIDPGLASPAEMLE